jgi:hypothetical protein
MKCNTQSKLHQSTILIDNKMYVIDGDLPSSFPSKHNGISYFKKRNASINKSFIQILTKMIQLFSIILVFEFASVESQQTDGHGHSVH